MSADKSMDEKVRDLPTKKIDNDKADQVKGGTISKTLPKPGNLTSNLVARAPIGAGAGPYQPSLTQSPRAARHVR
jgi:hypothetical protein